ncbi:ribosome-associated protein [Desulfatibacillum alkenivorans DSM 16219]|jgi:ribosome-associated protein|uniref:Ribosome-associated protein n=1 Tax=Desulfatibacillum alkenivorans DSM 16219 TaxID=1121393 RepID=A0A1M6U1A3_9BACT|nr:alternative ribosome rescue aminoacyl-tRNA hydrolase ArfB [Desulfatibacillum alkenivorans]SHK62868.1 ribosome-associated protein [Desulfatibacillum alkenivorans DSM 16219]
MIIVNDRVSLNEEEIDYEFVRSSGPGGQNVNKVSTAVQLRFDVANSPSLPEDVRARLEKIAYNRISASGVLLIDSRGTRSQLKNKEEALERLVRLIDLACRKPKVRKKTRPTLASRQRRLDSKKKRSRKKQFRGKVSSWD